MSRQLRSGGLLSVLKSFRLNRLLLLLPLLVCVVLFRWGTAQLAQKPLPPQIEQLRVRLPLPVQVATAAGDRYLAAGINVFRATTLGVNARGRTTYRVQGMLQVDAAFLNPAHEDNYYIATAILPWQGYADHAQYVLKRAMDGRPADPYPAFYYAFNLQYFKGDYIGAARVIEATAHKVDGRDRLFLLNLASKWYERVDDPDIAIKTITALLNSTRDEALRAHLRKRLQRVRIVAQLQQAAAAYQQRTGQPLQRLDQLVEQRLMAGIPADPLGEGFVVNKGKVAVNRPNSAGSQEE